jgi:hypothetical protein
MGNRAKTMVMCQEKYRKGTIINKKEMKRLIDENFDKITMEMRERTKYSDGTYRYENYPYFFPHQIAALSWGRAYDQAQKDLAETQKYIKELLDQVSGN